MRKEDLKDWTVDRLKNEIINLSEKNFHLEWRIKQFEESEGRWKCENESLKNDCKSLSDRVLKAEQENSRLEEISKTSSELIELLKKELEKRDTLEIIASGYKTERQRLRCGQSNADRLISKPQDQYQQDCIRYNDMRTAYLVTLDELARLREQFGIGR